MRREPLHIHAVDNGITSRKNLLMGGGFAARERDYISFLGMNSDGTLASTNAFKRFDQTWEQNAGSRFRIEEKILKP